MFISFQFLLFHTFLFQPEYGAQANILNVYQEKKLLAVVGLTNFALPIPHIIMHSKAICKEKKKKLNENEKKKKRNDKIN